jgi:beta-N-acetylhexosaminidase
MSDETDGMSLEQQIGQLFMVGFAGTHASPDVLDLIERHHVGGVIFFSRNIGTARQVADLTRSLQGAARAAGHHAPLLISIDQENGMVSRLGNDMTAFPGNMALGAIGSEQIAADVARATGEELKTLGINMNLAPDADVNNNPANPVIGVRSFGEDPQDVARLTAAAVRGYRSAGVISTLKHFPGHGDTATDSHLALPIIPHPLERLAAVEFAPFERGIAAGAEGVMIAHLFLPALMPSDGLSASVSPAVIQGLLRERLGYTGVVLSDCMEMDAITNTVGTAQGSVLALQAGTDIVLVSHRYDRQRASIEAALAAVHSGALPPEAIHQAARRVLRLKRRALSWEHASPAASFAWAGSPAHRQLAQRAYEQSTTLVLNKDALLPLRLKPAERLLVLLPQPHRFSQASDRAQHHEFLLENIRQRHRNAEVIVLSSEPTGAERELALHVASSVKATIMLTLNANLDHHQALLMGDMLRSGVPVIGVAAGQPYDVLAFPALRSYLVTYEYTRPALAAAVRVLFGEIPARGHLPVSLPGLDSISLTAS